MIRFADPFHFISILLKRRWLVLIVTTICFVSSGIYARQQTDYYAATAKVLSGRSAETKTLHDLNIPADAATKLDLIRYYGTKDREETTRKLSALISSKWIGETRILSISAKDSNAVWAAKIANQLAQSYVQKMREEKGSGDEFKVIEPALIPQSPAGPNRRNIVFASICLGLILASSLALALESPTKR